MYISLYIYQYTILNSDLEFFHFAIDKSNSKEEIVMEFFTNSGPSAHFKSLYTEYVDISAHAWLYIENICKIVIYPNEFKWTSIIW